MRGIGVAFNSYITSHIGAQGMGLLTLTSGIFGFAITLATSGINLAVVRLVSEDLAKKGERIGRIMSSALIYCLIFSVSTSLLLFFNADFVASILGDKRTLLSIKLFSISLVPISISSAINGYFCAIRRVYKNLIVQFIEQGIKISAVSYLIILFAPSGLEFACTAIIAGGVISEAMSAVLSCILYFIDRSKSSQPSDICISASKGELGKICAVALPVAISAYARSALSAIEHLAIPWGLRQYGLNYESAISSFGVLHGMVFPLLFFPSAILGSFSSLLIPELAEANTRANSRRIKYIVSRAFALSLLFSVGVSGIFVSFSYEIGLFLYNSSEAGEYIRLLAPLIPLMYLDGAVDAMLKGLGEQVYAMRVNISDSLISLLLVLILLPRLGIKGYIIIIFVTEIFNTSFSIIKLLSLTNVKTPVVKWILKPLVTIILSTAITRFLFDYNIMTAVFGIVSYGKGYVGIEIIACALLYLIISRLIGAISKDDVEWGKQILSLKKS